MIKFAAGLAVLIAWTLTTHFAPEAPRVAVLAAGLLGWIAREITRRKAP